MFAKVGFVVLCRLRVELDESVSQLWVSGLDVNQVSLVIEMINFGGWTGVKEIIPVYWVP